MQNVSCYFMRTRLFISAFLISNFTFGQSPYARLNNEFRSLFDNIPIDKGQEEKYFTYAKDLFNKDSLKKAVKIFDRLYWLDTSTTISKKSLNFRNSIEQKVISQTRENLLNSWNWGWSGTNWGATETQANTNKTKRLVILKNTIEFYINDTLVRTTKYDLTQSFNWVGGYLTNLIIYDDTKEQWYYNLMGWDTFTSDNLRIEQKTNYVCGNYGETYGLSK